MRKPFIAGNWKMNGVAEAAVSLARDVQERVRGLDTTRVDVAIFPPYIALQAVSEAIAGGPLHLGGQDLFWKESGAYTGKISGPMLGSVGCDMVIIGHSECRGRFGKAEADIDAETIQQFGDNDLTVALKVRAAFQHGLAPILCVGETLVERQSGIIDQVIESQVRIALERLDPGECARITVAYEPVWAIGTGHTCEPGEANRVCGIIRRIVDKCSPGAGETLRVQYGGSVTADNAAELLSHPEIDGALVGGQSLKADAFARIVQAALA